MGLDTVPLPHDLMPRVATTPRLSSPASAASSMCVLLGRTPERVCSAGHDSFVLEAEDLGGFSRGASNSTWLE